MILRELPDIPPRPKTSANAAFRRWLYSRWGKENAIVGARMRRAEVAPLAQPLSIKTVWGGSSEHVLEGRRVRVGDDTFVVLNEDRYYGSVWHSAHSGRDMESLCIFLKRGMPAEVFGAVSMTLSEVADAGTDARPRPVGFGEHLRPHDTTISPFLRELYVAVRAGSRDEGWFDECYQDLVEMLIAAEHRLRRRAENLASVRPGTRAELSRRIGWATDYILSNYAEPIALDDIASAAHLSKFHLVRLFRQVHGTTPHDYLQRKRAQAARRLIEDGSMELNEVAAIAGFGSRWSMFRHLHRCFGASGTKLRRQRECSLAPATAPRSEVALDEAEPVSCG